MATIKISDLHSAGSELFIDSESYLNELTNEELNMAHGGSTPVCLAWSFATLSSVVTTVASYATIYTRRA
jgi:hypothetical protein